MDRRERDFNATRPAFPASQGHCCPREPTTHHHEIASRTTRAGWDVGLHCCYGRQFWEAAATFSHGLPLREGARPGPRVEFLHDPVTDPGSSLQAVHPLELAHKRTSNQQQGSPSLAEAAFVSVSASVPTDYIGTGSTAITTMTLIDSSFRGYQVPLVRRMPLIGDEHFQHSPASRRLVRVAVPAVCCARDQKGCFRECSWEVHVSVGSPTNPVQRLSERGQLLDSPCHFKFQPKPAVSKRLIGRCFLITK